MSAYHTPVLLKESVDGLNIHSDGIYVDVTYGGGGHSAEILRRLTSGRLFAFDQDAEAAKKLPQSPRFHFTQGNFKFLKNYLNHYGVSAIDGLLADLGVSSYHFNTPDRGFSYRANAPLDMRMNQQAPLTAEKVVNEYPEEKLTQIFKLYGEITQARKLAAAIIHKRTEKKIVTTTQLVQCIEWVWAHQTDNQLLSKVFQAIRIEVNNELESLKILLSSTLEMLKPEGRLAIISYHSLEDRMVKNFMRWGDPYIEPVKDIYGRSHEPFRVLTRKPITAKQVEISENSRARSAHLRIAEKKPMA
jgi:16S rRNA (cytosine1402-N4)-methyltransferase